MLSTTNKTEYVTALKKVYSSLSQATIMYQAENGAISSAFSGDGDTDHAASVSALSSLANYLNITKNCGSSMGCVPDTPLKYLSGTVAHYTPDTYWDGQHAKAILNDGSYILIHDLDGECTTDKGDGPLNNTCGFIDVDVNGFKAPNIRGRDSFEFWITLNGVYPVGAFNDGYSCDTSSTSWVTSNGCTAKVLQENAMDY